MELRETEEALDSVYVIHVKMLADWTTPDLLFVLFSAWNDFGLLNYETHTQHTLSGLALVDALENTQKLHAGDELLAVVDEARHELRIYSKDNFLAVGAEGSSKHISQRNKHKQRSHYDAYLRHCERQPFRLLLALKTDLLNECFKVFFLQNSKTCRVTTPTQCQVTDPQKDFERIKRKYNL